MFSDEESQHFPPSRPWDHTIELKPNAPSHLRCKVYPMTREEDGALDKFIDEQLLKGYIEPSKSPYASPFFFIKKKDGKLRPVQDYHALNAWTVKNQYPLLLILVLIHDLGCHGLCFTTVYSDLRHGSSYSMTFSYLCLTSCDSL